MNGSNDARAEGEGRIYQATGDQHITENHHYAPEWAGPDSVRHPAVGRPPKVLRDRAGELDRLRAAVERGASNRVYVLYGLGGCGKTAVAYTIFNHAVTEAGRVGLWVNASGPASLRSAMLAVAADRGATDAELTGARSGLRPAADLVWDYLDRSGQPWLLVLDNADDPAILRDGGWLRTSPAGTVIVTSRQASAHWWPGAELLQFGVLPRDQAALVLRDLAPDAGSVEDAAAVADRLGRLPLALILAGGFLAHQVIDPWTLEDYRRVLDDSAGTDPIELLDQGSDEFGGDSRHLVGRTWQLSLDVLAARGRPEAAVLLRLLACCAGDPLPVSLLSGADLGPDLPASRVESALRGLLDQSLTELVPGDVRCLRTHGVLLDSVARSISADQREQIVATVTRLLLALLPEISERGPQDPRVILLAPHVLTFLRRTVNWAPSSPAVEVSAECALRLVTAVHRSGDYSAALILAREAAALAARGLGEENPLTIRLNRRIGNSLFRLGRFQESEEVHRTVLQICEQAPGTNELDILETCRALAKPIYNLGRPLEAVELCETAVGGLAEILGNSHQITLIAKSHLLVYAADAGMNHIVDLGPEIIMECRSVFGEDHDRTAVAELNYGHALCCVNRTIESLVYVQRAYDHCSRVLGPDYPITLSARQMLGQAHAELGHYADAIAHLESVVEGRIRVLGKNHPWSRGAEEYLAEVTRRSGRA